MAVLLTKVVGVDLHKISSQLILVAVNLSLKIVNLIRDLWIKFIDKADCLNQSIP